MTNRFITIEFGKSLCSKGNYRMSVRVDRVVEVIQRAKEICFHLLATENDPGPDDRSLVIYLEEYNTEKEATARFKEITEQLG